MSASSDQWYVEMSAGMTLGPMPFADVVELAQTSALMKNDRVREASTTSWQEAHEVRGLFDAEPVTDESEPKAADQGVVSLAGYEVPETATEDTVQNGPPKTESPGGIVRLDEFEVPPSESASS